MPKQLGDIRLYTLLELSRKLETTAVTLRKYLKQGRLKGQKVGNRFYITEENLREFFNGASNKTTNKCMSVKYK